MRNNIYNFVMKRLLFVSTLLLILSFLFVPHLYAQQKKPVIAELSQSKTVPKDYFTTGDVVRVMGTVNGDTYAAGGTVDVSGNINGDLLVAGGNIFISGTVKNDIRVAGGNITLSGAKVGGNITTLGGQIIVDKQSTIGGSVTAAGGSLKFFGPITKGVTVAGGQVDVGTNVGGDILAGVGNLTLLSGTDVKGDINYWSEEKATVQDGVKISGKVNQHIPERKPQDTRKAAETLAGIILFLRFADTLMLLIVGLLVISLLPVYFESSYQYIRTRFWLTMLVGLIGVIVTPIIILLLISSVIGIPLALFLMVLYIFVIWFVRIFPLILLGRFLLSKTNSKAGNMWAFVLGLIIYSILCLIPIVASLTFIVTALSGYGTLIMQKRNYYTTLRGKKLI